MTASTADLRTLKDTGLVCAVDMGSNTFKFIVAEIKNGKYLQYADERITVGIGDDVNNSEKKFGRKIISDSKIKELQSLLSSFQDQCKEQTKSRKLYGIATAAFREAENGKAVSELFRQQGIAARILTPEEESIYAYEAATLGEADTAVVDLGSRTTELISRSGSKYDWVALATGYKTAWNDFYDSAETFGDAATQHVAKLKTLIGENEKRILLHQKRLVLIEIGETSSYVLGIPQVQTESKIVTRKQIQDKMKELSSMNKESFAELKRNFKDAVKVLPRLVLVDFLLQETGYTEFRATNRELNVTIVYRLSRGSL